MNILDINAEAIQALSVTLKYSDNSSFSYNIAENDEISILYLKSGKLYTKTGKIKSILARAFQDKALKQLTLASGIYSMDKDVQIVLDCSEQHASEILYIPLIAVRGINDSIDKYYEPEPDTPVGPESPETPIVETSSCMGSITIKAVEE